MSDFLVNYAVNNFWCNPQQDKQGIFKIARLTPVFGATNYYPVLIQNTILPTPKETYHLFQIGQVTPTILGLLGQTPGWAYDGWMSMSDTMNAIPLFVDIYNANGIHIPRFEVFYRFTLSRDLIIAIKFNSNIPVNYGTDDIYLRVYSNAYFQSAQSTVPIAYTGLNAGTTQLVLNFQTQYNTYAAQSGGVFCYCNGLLIDSASLVTIPVGSTVEMIYDPSVKHQFTVPMSTVQTFVSVLDSKTKYLLHDTVAQNLTINYQDDIEIYIVNPVSGHYTGVYYHRNAFDAYRSVTHRDYAIGVDYATSLMQAFQAMPSSGITSLNQLSFVVIVRKSGFNHALVYEDNRVQELYKLSDSQVMQALVGVNSTNAIWQAPNLENSLYTQVMRAQGSQLNDTLVQNALGYNAMSKIAANTPSPVYTVSSQILADVPPGLQSGYCAYEYDSAGHLLTYTNSLTGSPYVVQNPATTEVEMVYGLGGNTAPAYFGQNTVTFNTAANFRVYTTQMLSTGVPGDFWTDQTGSGLYTVSGTTLTWTQANSGLYIMVRTDERIVNYDLNLIPQDGLLYFSFSEMQNRDGNLQNYVMNVPMRDITLFLNGQSLIENIDYNIQYPKVVILNTSALIQPATTTAQTIHVRMSGFCSSTLAYEPAYDTGFIADGAFANSYRYDVMDDSVNRIAVGGRYMTPSQMQINDSEAGVLVDPSLNGSPYSISKPMIPLYGLLGTDLETFMAHSKTIDTQVADYLSLQLPKPTVNLQTIPSAYPVLSPFICKIIYQLVNNEESNGSLITSSMTDNDILTFCKPYESWLAFDPIITANTIDPRFIRIIPINSNFAVQLPLAQYQFIQRAIGLYAKNPMVSIASYVQLKPLS